MLLALQKKNSKPIFEDPNIVSLVENLQNKTGISVELFHNKNRGGRIIFKYTNLAQLDQLVKAIIEKY